MPAPAPPAHPAEEDSKKADTKPLEPDLVVLPDKEGAAAVANSSGTGSPSLAALASEAVAPAAVPVPAEPKSQGQPRHMEADTSMRVDDALLVFDSLPRRGSTRPLVLDSPGSPSKLVGSTYRPHTHQVAPDRRVGRCFHLTPRPVYSVLFAARPSTVLYILPSTAKVRGRNGTVPDHKFGKAGALSWAGKRDIVAVGLAHDCLQFARAPTDIMTAHENLRGYSWQRPTPLVQKNERMGQPYVEYYMFGYGEECPVAKSDSQGESVFVCFRGSGETRCGCGCSAAHHHAS